MSDSPCASRSNQNGGVVGLRLPIPERGSVPSKKLPPALGICWHSAPDNPGLHSELSGGKLIPSSSPDSLLEFCIADRGRFA